MISAVNSPIKHSSPRNSYSNVLKYTRMRRSSKREMCFAATKYLIVHKYFIISDFIIAACIGMSIIDHNAKDCG